MALKPPVQVPQGAIRLNTDSQKLEFYAQDQWWEMATHIGDSTGGTRGCIGFKFDDSANAGVIDYVTIETQGNAVDFGDLTYTYYGGSCGSATRGFWFGGQASPSTDTIEYVEFATPSNAIDFGNLTGAIRYSPAGVSDKTRGIRTGGTTSPSSSIDIIDYWTMSITGNAIDFGDMNVATRFACSCNSATRGVIAGGDTAPGQTNRIEFITMQTLGNGIDFGDLSTAGGNGGNGACGSPTRGLFAIGYQNSPGAYVNTVEFITIASTGNAQDFGDTTLTRGYSGTTSSSTRGINAGGFSPAYFNTIDYCTIATTGNFVDFGDRTVGGSYCSGTSNGHGGLG